MILRKKTRFSKACRTIAALGRKKISLNAVLCGYYNINNFGDQLTPDILRFFNKEPIHVPRFRYAEMIGAGSIMHMVPADYAGTILGAGFISSEHTNNFSRAEIKLVRGYLSRELLHQDDTEILVGDPGLISDTIYSKSRCAVKEYNLGVVLHYCDLRLRTMMSNLLNSDGVLFIDVMRPPKDVFYDISRCSSIISSSLHGLIMADSLGIRNRWIRLGNGIIGGDFKYRDYYSCYNLAPEPFVVNGNESPEMFIEQTAKIDSADIDIIKNNIISAYHSFLFDNEG